MAPPTGETGWDDWNEDQRRALGRSHKRTVGSLEEPPTPTIRAQDPPKVQQILPANLEQEAALSKQRKNIEKSSQHQFPSVRCALIVATAVVCLSGMVAAVLILLPSSDYIYTSKTTMAYSSRNTASKPSYHTFLRNPAYWFGRNSEDNDLRHKFAYPDYAMAGVREEHSDELNSWTAPDYDGLFSPIDNPLYQVQPILLFTSRSGSRTIMDVLSYCGKLVLASDAAIGHEDEDVCTLVVSTALIDRLVSHISSSIETRSIHVS